MSYILDALRKAEAERERGNVPSIHAQPAFAGARPGAPRERSRVWAVALAIAGLLIVVGVVYLLFGRAPVVPVAQTPTPTPPVIAAAPAPAVAPVIAPIITPPIAPTIEATTPAAPVVSSVRKPRIAASAPPAVSSTASAAAAPRTDERIPAMSELPDDLRRQLPALSVGGSVYSPTPASRLVIVNGQVLHEGERIGADLVVQQIRPKAAVLAFKGTRFLLPF